VISDPASIARTSGGSGVERCVEVVRIGSAGGGVANAGAV
jgi:hypothetical protein